ncbi:MAG: hypothetical protein AAF368_02805, partial [Planctomycetota bacterium]
KLMEEMANSALNMEKFQSLWQQFVSLDFDFGMPHFNLAFYSDSLQHADQVKGLQLYIHDLRVSGQVTKQDAQARSAAYAPGPEMTFALRELNAHISDIQGSYFDGENLLGLAHMDKPQTSPSRAPSEFCVSEFRRDSLSSEDSLRVPRTPKGPRLQTAHLPGSARLKAGAGRPNPFGGDAVRYYSHLNTLGEVEARSVGLSGSEAAGEKGKGGGGDAKGADEGVFVKNDSVDNVSRFRETGLFGGEPGPVYYHNPYPRRRPRASKFQSNGVFLELRGLELSQVA